MSKLKNSVDELIADMELKRDTETSGSYDERISTLIDDLYGDSQTSFEYDAESDPNYQTAVKDYTREADRTMRDTLAQGAAQTGGIASTAAVTAASQARDYQMSQLADAKTELYNQALTRHENEISAKYQILSALENLSEEEQDNYLSLLQLQESAEADEKSEAQTQIQNMLALGLTPSQELIDASGWGSDYVTALEKANVDSMDTAAVQQYLNARGASLEVDGSWGPKTEAAYQALFGTASGNYTASSYTGTTATPTATPTTNNPTATGDYYSVGGANFTDEGRAELYQLYKNGDITYDQYIRRLKAYAGH